MKILIGADPEFFLMQNGKHKSAVGLIGGSKWKPLFIDNEGNAIQEDNVSVEFNVKPSETKEEFRSVINKVLSHLRNKLTSFEFSTDSAATFDKEELNTPEARMFGCEPDFNAWSMKQNPKPHSNNKQLRSAGGHVHIGCEIAQQKPIKVIRACDLFLGVPSIEYDKGVERRELYGLAGSFRKKDYGVEYRSLSNWWIFNDWSIEWVFEQTQKAINFVMSNNIDKEDYFNIQKCINLSCYDTYLYLKSKYNL